MSHASRIVQCTGPQDPHAFDGISVRYRTGDLDKICPVCAGYGQWNAQIDLVSQRSIREPCPKCDGRGWIETGEDLVPSNETVMTPEGHPKWQVRLDPTDDAE